MRCRLFVAMFIIFISSLALSQVRIKEKVVLKNTSAAPVSIINNSDDGTQQVKLEVSFNPYSYPFGTETGDIFGNAVLFIEDEYSFQTILAEVKKQQNGSINLSAEIPRLDPTRYYSLKANISFGTSLGHTPNYYNVGNAGVKVKVYLNNNLIGNKYFNDYENYFFNKPLDIVTDPPCGQDAPQCDGEPNFKGFKMNTIYSRVFQKEGFYDKYLCNLDGGAEALSMILTDGQFHIKSKTYPYLYEPIQNEYYMPYDIQPCYNNSEDPSNKGWQFKLKTIDKEEDYIYINAQIAFCDRGPKTIYSIDELNTIEEENICQALIDFELERYRKAESYDPYEYGDYSIADVTWEHEKYHIRDFGRHINKIFNSPTELNFTAAHKTRGKFRALFNNLFYCSDYIPNYSKAKERGEYYYELLLRKIVDQSIKTWGKYKVVVQGKSYQLMELYAHWSDNVQKKIDKFQRVLVDRLDSLELSCNYKKDWTPFLKFKNNR